MSTVGVALRMSRRGIVAVGAPVLRAAGLAASRVVGHVRWRVGMARLGRREGWPVVVTVVFGVLGALFVAAAVAGWSA